MKLEIEFDVIREAEKSTRNDGQIAVKLPKEDEIRWLVLNKRYGKKLSESLRTVVLKFIEAHEKAA